MTYKDIKKRFLIEYDKANVTSSYPSLTDTEIAAILDKAYLATIAQKVTGNNIRKSYLEADIKSISDLQELITRTELTLKSSVEETPDDPKPVLPENVKFVEFPDKFMYYVSAFAEIHNGAVPMQIVNHATAKRFFVGPYNKPWIKIPVCYIHENKIFVVYDTDEEVNTIYLDYIKEPELFSSVLKVHAGIDSNGDKIYTDIANIDREDLKCNDTLAEEIISLAIIFALENVESTRLNSKLNTKGFEA